MNISSRCLKVGQGKLKMPAVQTSIDRAKICIAIVSSGNSSSRMMVQEIKETFQYCQENFRPDGIKYESYSYSFI